VFYGVLTLYVTSAVVAEAQVAAAAAEIARSSSAEYKNF